jgi:hypothetical protein
MSASKRADTYRRGAAKGADDRARGRSISDWSAAERSCIEGWGLAGWRGYWDAHSDEDRDRDAGARMGWWRQAATGALGLAGAGLLLVSGELKRRAREDQ